MFRIYWDYRVCKTFSWSGAVASQGPRFSDFGFCKLFPLFQVFVLCQAAEVLAVALRLSLGRWKEVM